jgi:anti-sigma factor RsiW
METMISHTNQPTTHHDYSELMSLALDGMLSAGEQQHLDQHLSACPACQGTWGAWQRISHVLTAEPFAGPPQGFALRFDAVLQRQEQRQERVLAGWVLAGGTLVVLALIMLGTALTTALWMALAPNARGELVDTLGFAGQFAALVFQNLAAVRDGIAALLPDPVIMLAVALALVLAGAAWIGLVFFGGRGSMASDQ